MCGCWYIYTLNMHEMLRKEKNKKKVKETEKFFICKFAIIRFGISIPTSESNEV